MESIDLTSYGGIGIALLIVIEAAKRFFRARVDGHEEQLAIVFALLIGVGAKVTISEAFDGVAWVTHIVSLVAVAVGAGLAHDKILDPIKAALPKKNGDAPPAPEGGPK